MVNGLGATVGEYGLARSIVNLVSALSSVPAAMITERYPMKKLILLSLVLDIAVPLTYLLAINWQAAALAWVYEAVVLKFSGPPLQVIYIASLKDRDRATCMGISTTVRSIVGITSPLIAAALVSYSGGLTADGIRPVFLVSLIVLVANIVLIWRRLEEVKIDHPSTAFSLRHFADVFKGDKALQRYTVMESMREFVINVVNPYAILYAVLIKGADAYILGLMSTAELLPMILFAVPLGRLSDKIGRKKMVYIFRPIRYAADIGLILVPDATMLPIVQFIRGFRLVSQEVSWTAFSHELVPIDKRIRYVAVTTLVNGIGAFA
ncbi:MAG: MFS transporter, partial [Candidatus Bathyarchaeia archaeon]